MKGLMKLLFLMLSTLVLSACDGGGKGSQGQSPSIVSGGQVSEQQLVKEYAQKSLETVPEDLRLSDQDIQEIAQEVGLTQEEIGTLNDLKKL